LSEEEHPLQFSPEVFGDVARLGLTLEKKAGEAKKDCMCGAVIH